MNVSVITGRLTKDPELRTTPNNTPVCTFDVAVDRDYSKDKDLVWQVQDKRTGKWIASDKPPYKEDKRFCESPNENQLKLF